MADNSISLVGNLTKDPELRFSNSGQAICSMSLAVNVRKRNAAGEYEDDPKFFDLTAFGQTAENVASSLVKGNRIIVFGRLDWQQWTNDAGEKRSKVQVLADSIGVDLRFNTASIEKVQRNQGF
jgi:single-strand DNA-binding protein